MAYNQYDEGVSSRSAQHRGGSVGGNISNGALPANSSTAGGGNQVIDTSSNIDGVSEFSGERSTNNIPDDPKAYVSSNDSIVVTGQIIVGLLNGSVTGTQTAGTTAGLKTVSLGTTNALGISSVSWSGVTYPTSGIVANASGSGYAFSGQSIVWNNGTYSDYTTPMASGWVPSGSANFLVAYTYSGNTINNNIPSILTPGQQQAFIGNAGNTLGAGSSFGGPEITR